MKTPRAILILILALATPAAAGDCEEACARLAEQVLDACLLAGGEPVACREQADAVRADCLQSCAPADRVFPLVMCTEMVDRQNDGANGFPWENSASFFGTYRNQYLYPSRTLLALRALGIETIDSIHARAVSFGGSSTNSYGSFGNGLDSTITIHEAITDVLVSTFAENVHGDIIGQISGRGRDQMVITTMRGPNGATLSTCVSCPEGDRWFEPIELADTPGLIVDTTLAIGFGNAGASMWDVTSTAFGGGCDGPRRAFGSGSFQNFDHLTTAIGVDDNAFVWVFRGRVARSLGFTQRLERSLELLLTPAGREAAGRAERPSAGPVADAGPVPSDNALPRPNRNDAPRL